MQLGGTRFVGGVTEGAADRADVDRVGVRPTVGVFADSTDRSMPILELAAAIEARGFTGLFLNEHPHLPVANERSQYPPGGRIPSRYARFWDPYIALSFVAARTTLDVGPFISLVGEHDAIALAKAVATLDTLSNGRLVLGVGWGWHREEFEDHGLPANVRAKVLEETVELMTALWTHEVGSYEGTYRRVSPSQLWPKPVQQPRPPVLLGVPPSEKNFARVARFADGWVPMMVDIFDPALAAALATIRQLWTDAGRPGAPRFSHLLTGLPNDRLPAAVERAAELGIERVCLYVMGAQSDVILPHLDDAHDRLAPLWS